jgi:ATP-dependent helicase Lhr and Lhr-like helicase
MRPWMVVVLSDFGRDRVAYQQYENLVDPEVKPRALPLGNIHILKMQAAQAVLDWLSRRIDKSRIWNWLNQRPACSFAERQQFLKHVDLAMRAGPAQDELCAYIREALTVDTAVLDQILWQAPRALLLEFLPTLRRRLASNWAAWSDEAHESVELAESVQQWGSPVPEFIPDNSFADLASPDLSIILDRQGGMRREPMPFFQGLKEFAPGRVSKRFAIEAGALSDWLVPDELAPANDEPLVDFEITSAFGSTLEPLGGDPVNENGETLFVYQPRNIFPKRREGAKAASDTSNAFLRWRSNFASRLGADWHPVPRASNWSGYLKGTGFFLHSLMSPLELIRYCDGSDAEIRLKNGSTRRMRFRWTKDGSRVAIGTRMYVDAARIDFEIPRDVIRQWLCRREVQKAVRSALFQDRLRVAAVFAGDTFAAHWVAECFLAAVSIEAELSAVDLAIATKTVCGGNGTVPLQSIPDYLFQLDREVDDSDGDAEASKEQRLQRDLKARLADPEVLATLCAEAACLHSDFSASNDSVDWAWGVIGNTLAAAFQQAICTLVPHADEQSVNAEYEAGPLETGKLHVWLTEADSGGMGIIAELREVLLSDPLKFLNAASRALEPGSYEQMDTDLHAALQEAIFGDGLVEAFAAVRNSSCYQERLAANRLLRRSLTHKGFMVNHTFASILFSRVLRPGSGETTDREILEHLEQWDRIESRNGMELPLNVACTAIAVTQQVGVSPAAAFARACGIMSMLWVRGAAVRQASLGYYNRFQAIGDARTERLLGAMVCEDQTPSVQFSDGNWLSDVHGVLDETGSVDLIIERAKWSVIPAVVATLHVVPLDTHGLLLYPRVRSARRGTNHIHLWIELPEAIN